MSATWAAEPFLAAWTELFTELYHGPKDISRTWVVTNEPDSSLLRLIQGLSAQEASRLTPSGQSIASHIEHLRWSLALGNSYFRGENPQPNWEESWSVTTVDARQWDQLRTDLQTEADTLRGAVSSHTDWSDPIFFTGTFASSRMLLIIWEPFARCLPP